MAFRFFFRRFTSFRIRCVFNWPVHQRTRGPGQLVAIERYPKPLPVLNAGLLHLWFLKHEHPKPFGVPQGSDMDATLTAEQIVQFLKMLIHLWNSMPVSAVSTTSMGISCSIINRSMAVLSLPPERETAWKLPLYVLLSVKLILPPPSGSGLSCVTACRPRWGYKLPILHTAEYVAVFYHDAL